LQAYTPEHYQQLIIGIGFTEIEFLPGLAHGRIIPVSEFHAIVARKPT
jgi:hypothetical protein